MKYCKTVSTAVLLALLIFSETFRPERAVADAKPSATSSSSEQISSDDPASLQRGIDAAFKSGLKKIVIPPGIYRVKPDHLYLRFENMNDFEIDATGVTLLRSDSTRSGIQFNHCHGVTFRGMTLLNEIPPFTQGTIEAIDPAWKSLDLRICAGFPANFDDPRYFPKTPTGYVFDPKTRQWKSGTSDVGITQLERLEPGKFRLYFRGADRMKDVVNVGDEMAFRGNGGADIRLTDCDHVKLLDVVIRNGTGFCVHETDGEGDNFYRYNIEYGPRPAGATEDPLIACNADGFHSSYIRHGPTLEDCHFEGMPDDGVAIHGNFAMVADSDADSLVILYAHAPFFRVGDPLRLFDSKGQFTGEANVKAVEPLKDYLPKSAVKRARYLESQRYFRLTLDHPISAHFNDLVDDPSANGSNYVVRNCVIRNHRARGMLLKADNGLVENNTIDGSTMAGIVVAPELWWNESGYGRNVILRGNMVRHVGYQNAGPWMDQAGAITVRGEGDNVKKPVMIEGDHFGHRHIVIENNTVADCDGLQLLVSSASDVSITGNKFVHAQEHPSNRGADHVDPEAIIQIGPCRDVRLSGNVVVDRGSSGGKLVEAVDPTQVHGLPDGLTTSNTGP